MVQPEPSQKVAELDLDARMALLILSMKAILGYIALALPTSRNLCVGGMLLKDLRIGFCLCGADELRRADWNLKSYGPASSRCSAALASGPQVCPLVALTCTLT